MRMPRARDVISIAIAPLLLGVPLATAAAARAASTCEAWTGVQPPNPGGATRPNLLAAAAVLSPCAAWAVGSYSNGTATQTLVVRWNGRAWTKAASPNPGGTSHDNYLAAVAATSSGNAWAVGGYSNGTALRTLITRWNGKAWTKVASPNPGGSSHDNFLTGVAGNSAGNAWVVGGYFNGTAFQTLIVHWNGKAWTKVASPNPGGSSRNNFINAVTVTPAGGAWAVGEYFNGTAYRTLILRWNGKAWRKVASPNGGSVSAPNLLTGVTAASAGNAWAVGSYNIGTVAQTLIVHWNGSSWKKVASPNAGSASDPNLLAGVTATSAGNAWAVGSYNIGTVTQTLIVHWNGSSWKKVASPDPGGPAHLNLLNGVAATSASNAWAVGGYAKSSAEQTLIVHWNGTAWKTVPSPDPGGSSRFNDLSGIAASSAGNAWAVGDYADSGLAIQTLAVHCC